MTGWEYGGEATELFYTLREQEREAMHGWRHVVYVIRFSHDRIKVGRTANVEKRLAYYKQEGRRNGFEVIRHFQTAPLPNAMLAKVLERICLRWAVNAVGCRALNRHREWFAGGENSYNMLIDRVGYARLLMRTCRYVDVAEYQEWRGGDIVHTGAGAREYQRRIGAAQAVCA